MKPKNKLLCTCREEIAYSHKVKQKKEKKEEEEEERKKKTDYFKLV